MKYLITKSVLVSGLLFGLTACGTIDRLRNVGKDPQLSNIQNPVERPGYTPVSMPMPQKKIEMQQANSLWMSGRKGFFKDQRASQVGDILTIMINIKDNAKLKNKTDRTKDSSDDVNMPGFLGLESQITKVLPEGTLANNLIATNSTSTNTGEGKIERDEQIDLKVAAVITQILPNGNMVIHGQQQVRVNNERRDLEVAGIIRPEDITTANNISYEKIAEARISYGGQGMLTETNRPRYGNEVIDILSPF